MAIVEVEKGKLTILEDHEDVHGGRADFKGEIGYTQIDVTADDDEDGHIVLALCDNLTDVDGHWSPVVLTKKQCKVLVDFINLQ